MAWITPPDFVNGQVVTETQLDILSNDLTDLNTRVTTLSNYARGRMGSVSATSTITVTSEQIVDSVLNLSLTSGRWYRIDWEAAYDQASPPYPNLGIVYQAGPTITVAGATELYYVNIISSNLSTPFNCFALFQAPSTGAYSFASKARGNGGTLHLYTRALVVADIGA